MGVIGAIIIGGIIGWIAGAILGKDIPGGILGNIIAGLLGAWLGPLIFKEWGPHPAGIYIFPALLGSIILIFVVSLILKALRKK